MITLLRLGKILTKDGDSIHEMMDSKVCKLLVKHQNQIHNVYRPKELRELLENYGPELRGGGVKIEWTEITEGPMCRKRRYYFNFDRIYRPEEVMPNAQPLNESAPA